MRLVPADGVEHVPVDDVAAAHVLDQVPLDQVGEHPSVRGGVAAGCGRAVAQVRAERGQSAARLGVAAPALVKALIKLAPQFAEAFLGVEDGDHAGGSDAGDARRPRHGGCVALGRSTVVSDGSGRSS
ncbi:hypothetical protein [Yinghuangia sp. YIM S09857]|uniref:hypothetical protein n=1 Tax=Yinghuangia sp. YIM S09857 TaxID=3436929 RepID=UPI003F52E8D0